MRDPSFKAGSYPPPTQGRSDLLKYMEAAKPLKNYAPWFTMKAQSHRWWHWILHPFRTWKLRRWLKIVQRQVQERINMDDMDKMRMDMAIFGTATMEVKHDD